MRKLKSKVEICKLPSMTLVFYRGIEKHSSFPLVLVGAPCKGQAPGRVTPWIAPGLPHAQVGLRCAFRQASSGPLPAIFTIKLPAKPPWALFPSVHGGSHTTKRGWFDLTRLQAPPMYNNGARKHRVVRGVQTSLNTGPKPRASA